MAEHNALGFTGGASGVEQSCQIVFGNAVAESSWCCLSESCVVVVAAGNDMLHQIGKVARFAIANQHLGAGIFEGVVQFSVCMAGVQWDNHPAAGGNGCIGFEVFVTVVRKDSDPIALANTECRENPVQSFAAVVKLCVGEGPVARDNG